MPIRLMVADSAAEKTAARNVEARVFLEAFGNTPAVMTQEYAHYDDRSRLVTVIDESTGAALGAARLILPDHTGEVKTLTDVAREPWHLSVPESLRTAGLSGQPVWDVATLAVDRRYRSGAAGLEVTLALCHGLYEYSRVSGAQGLVTVLDDRVLRLLRAMGVPWTPLAGTRSQPYLGSPASTPCVCLVAAIGPSIRARRPDLAPAIVHGSFRAIALDPADLRPSRGAPPPRAAGRDLSDRPPAESDRRSSWRPPAHRRDGDLSDSLTPSAGADRGEVSRS